MLFCFLGIMTSFLIYGLLLEYATSRNGTKLHELSFLFVTSALYTTCAYMCRNIMNEKPNTSIPPHEFAVLGLTSMGSTFCSVRSLRYVIYPIQILAKSCKPIPVMLFGVVLGERYPLKKFINVGFIVSGVALFMGGGSSASKAGSSGSFVGLILLFISLCFDGGTGAYEDKLMRKSHVGPFDLMFNIQLGKTILSGVGLIIFNQTNEFTNMVNELGVVLLGLGISGAAGQVFIFLTISYFGALTCSIIGLARKVTTLVASIYVYGHHINVIQGCGLGVCVGAMVVNFWGKGGEKEKKEEGQGGEEERGLLKEDEDVEEGEVEMNEVGGSQVGGGVQIENV
ncbi:hypothetical protein TL16_g07250 [Triparma laevis f. inornata]|uniref:Uncharacterized protein n=2 Tax=Triparma laevis TaxID=1534972 RepID=A0A9W7KT70_9STRA|nr:hypothetical protein TL16_g07250 [Triparma laevis f. inornata]GMI10461.1 hypothetical protein TrLO_g8342 [Triparma laevis f. longispina]